MKKIAIVGCGALGSFYGAMLSRAGHEVHFLLRSDYEAVRRNGVEIRNTDGTLVARPVAACAPGEIGVCDIVLIGLKTTANDQFPVLLPPLVGPETLVVTLQNGMGNEERLARLFPAEQILGGLCFVCLNRIAPGVIVQTGRGVVVLGEHQRPPMQRTHDLATLFKNASVACKVTESLERAHWEKLVWNVPFNGLGVASAAGCDAMITESAAIRGAIQPCLTTDKLLGDSRWALLVRELMLEVIAVANALGHPIPVSYADHQIERTLPMGAYKASTLVDFERGQPLELESLFIEPLRHAEQARVPAPRLTALCRVLGQLDPAGKASA
ncbi:MAG TPA: 2-dehydropantoate 2-reductase [Verrucomicrobiota bacterium]|nr:2-dehydropantoate 2-reductase [Verrucomicrobiota bacterium]